VTSRGTGRWVVPKGNRITGLSPHAAAAHEAEEEAGVLGAVCPTPLGKFRYRKTRNNGASLMADVSLFPFAVTEELDDWLESGERERRWFPLEEAAAAVNEPDLAALIRNFRASDVAALTAQANKTFGATRLGGNSMLRWFQSMMPKQGNFFELFEAHTVTLIGGADALARLLQGGPGMNDHIKEIFEREHEADDITREVLQSVRRTFITPFDRSAITSLIGVMDDAIDQMNGTAKAIALYEVKTFEPQMRDMAGIIVDAARVTAEAIPLLRNVANNAGRLHDLTERLVTMEGHADEIHDRGLKALFKANAESPMQFIVGREIYQHLERTIDRFEDVANEIQGLVIDHA
jgi:predicted phosphate transport protein (TIGR00153 family)